MPTFALSTRMNKKYMTRTPKGKLVHFGSSEYEHYKDSTPIKYYSYLDHNDKKRRTRYRARHKAILKKDGKPAYLDPEQPAYYSYNFLW